MPVPKYQPLTLAPINFSLTEGTSIPAPPDSPPDTPRPPTPGKGPLSSHPTPKSGVFPQHRDDSPPAKDSVDSAADSTLNRSTTNDGASSMLSPASPTSTRRPSSVRKFLGLRSLPSSESLKSERPGSPATVHSTQSLTRKKSSSWFGKRKSTFGMAGLPEAKETQTSNANGLGGQHARPAAPPEKKGPPPPALPELQSFGVSEDTVSLGADDMFKNIK